jgi:hypothetical protein
MKSVSTACDNQKDFFDSNGNYLKTCCQISEEKIQRDACTSHGMNLFTVESVEMRENLLNFATEIFGDGHGSLLWVNGKKESDNKWYTYSPNKAEMVDGIFEEEYLQSFGGDSSESEEVTQNPRIIYDKSHPWSLKSQSQNRFSRFRRSLSTFNNPRFEHFRSKWSRDDSKTCLVASAFGEFKIESWTCNSNMYSFCEYNRFKHVETNDLENFGGSNEIRDVVKLQNDEMESISNEENKPRDDFVIATGNEEKINENESLPKAEKQIASKPQPRLEVCDKVADLLYANGKTSAVLCLVKQNLTYFDAINVCNDNFMLPYELFSTSKISFEETVKKFFSNYEKATAWIFGMKYQMLNLRIPNMDSRACAANYDKRRPEIDYEYFDTSDKFWVLCESENK